MPTLKETARKLLALPREAGTPEVAEARDLVAAHLKYLGYNVVLQRFTFTPASLLAFPVFGGGLGGLALLLLPTLVGQSLPAWAAPVVWLCGLAALTIVATGVGLGWVPFGQPLREDANLIATRGDGAPTRWIVAHIDSKAQAHSMAGRLVAVWMVALAIACLTLLAMLRLKAPLQLPVATAGVVLALTAGFLAGRGRLKGKSLGARDNGSGVVAALAAAAAAPDNRVGILITGAEEFGLVGARVFAKLTPHLGSAEFVNVDTVDQEGNLYLVSHDARGARLAGSLEPRLSGLAVPVQHRRLPLGIFVDSAPLARAGAPALTVGRLTWQTLGRIHTAADTPEGLSFRMAEQIGRAIVSN